MYRRFIKCFMVICLVFTIFIIGLGCVYTPRNLEESKTRTVMYKPDATHYAGQMVVYWNDRIYYVSAESGNDGIHSMKLDGSDVRFEFDVPKITRLIATDEAFYYVGVYEIQEKSHQLFALFMKPHGSEETQQLPTVYEYADSVYDAYIAQNGMMAVLETHNIGTTIPPIEVLEFVGNEPEVLVNWDMSYFEEGEPNSTNLFVYETGSLVYSTSVSGNDYEMENTTLVDSELGIRVMSSISHESMQYIKLLYGKDATLVFGDYNQLVLMDRYTREKYKRIKVESMEEDMWIDYVFECGGCGFVAIAKQEDRNNDKLFFINTHTDETVGLMKLSDKILIDVREGSVLYAQGNRIYCQTVDEMRLGDMIYEIKMPENLMRNKVFEIAGDWLFIHRHINNGWATNQLLYKVNLKTHEIVDVR